MKKIKTTKIELEITFEYDDAHFNLSAERMATATAIDMVVRPSESIEDSVKLISVCDSTNETYWLDRGREENRRDCVSNSLTIASRISTCHNMR